MKSLIKSTALLALLFFGIALGIAIHEFKFFPYNLIKQTYRFVLNKEPSKYGPWSIGLYEGSTPFQLSPVKGVTNPILTGESVTDIDASFVADPFFIQEKGDFYMFFEVLNRTTDQGDIGYATSSDGIEWNYESIVIDEDFHLSYPYVFKWEDEFYLIPESHEDLSIRLYKAESFPSKWTHVGNLVSGFPFIDPSVIRHNDMWWLFVANKGNETLNLFYSESLDGEWKPHKQNPIVKFDPNIARPGGRILSYDGQLYRFAQDDYPAYGLQVYALQISSLTPDSYQESIFENRPILTGSGEGWNKTGMHQLDVQKVGDRWLGVVDGHIR